MHKYQCRHVDSRGSGRTLVLFNLRCLLHRSRDAQEQYETALKYDADNPDLYYNVTYLLAYLLSQNFSFIFILKLFPNIV